MSCGSPTDKIHYFFTFLQSKLALFSVLPAGSLGVKVCISAALRGEGLPFAMPSIRNNLNIYRQNHASKLLTISRCATQSAGSEFP